jgi:hypothetical protein
MHSLATQSNPIFLDLSSPSYVPRLPQRATP